MVQTLVAQCSMLGMNLLTRLLTACGDIPIHGLIHSSYMNMNRLMHILINMLLKLPWAMWPEDAKKRLNKAGQLQSVKLVKS